MGVSVFRVPRRLYWVADRSRLVPHGDPEAAFLAFPAGAELSDVEARRYGFLDAVDAPVEAEKQHREITRNKMRGRPLDKAAVVEQTTTETTVVKEKP